MKTLLKIFGIILLIGFIATIFEDGSTSTNTNNVQKSNKKKTEQSFKHPSQSVLDAIQKSLDVNGEERWANWKVGYNKDEKNIYIQVAADPIANSIAIKGYIGLIKDIHKEHAEAFNLVGRVYQMGDLKESCYVYGK